MPPPWPFPLALADATLSSRTIPLLLFALYALARALLPASPGITAILLKRAR